MYIEAYNNNLFLYVLKELENGLLLTEHLISSAIASENYNDLESLLDIYDQLFNDSPLAEYFEFAISKTHKHLNFREVAFDRGNSYYHLKLLVKSPELIWLDVLYGDPLSRILKYYKALFSKIDNLFANNTARQKEVCDKLITGAKTEFEKLNSFSKAKEEINSERKRLQAQYLEKIPFEGLFHMTHLSNVAGILEMGILSHHKAREGGWMQRDISNPIINEKRSRLEGIHKKSIHDYAPLYINPKNPMLDARKKQMRDELILIRVNPNILVNENVLFTDGNAAEESSKFYKNLEDFNRLDWSCLHDEYYFNHQDGKRVRCSEVLVLNQIPLAYIDELYAFDAGSFELVLPCFPNHINISLKVKPDFFN